MANKIDLHIHTNFSDGALSPKEVIDMAQKNGVTVISITDHDTIDAYNEELYSYANSKNISIINGIEISTYIDKIGIHILGYDFDIKNKELNEKLIQIRNYRCKYLEDVSYKLEQLGYFINVDELLKNEVVTKAHIANDIINNIKNKDLLLKQFGYIPDKGQFIEKMMNAGCPAFVKKQTISPKEAVRIIKNAGGKAILAHPVAYKYEDNMSDSQIIDLINEIKVDGIESYYIYINSSSGNKTNEIDKWNTVAKNNKLMISIGSDFHIKDGIHPEIGLINEGLDIDDNIVNYIINDLVKVNK